jgi:hypothetical protein
MKISQTTHGKKVMYLGWAIALAALIYSVVAYIDIASDSSTQAFAFLVFIEGGFFILIGLVMIGIGYRMNKKSYPK